MKKILAISGGIDSMVMLHLFRNDPDAIVAHFNHGTRPSADDDESFVAKTAKAYNLPFYSGRADLGANISEEKARSARYAFLNTLAKKLHGEIYTAHHADDLIESIAINLLRGTGWRGLTPLTLHRHPLLSTGLNPLDRANVLWRKKDVLEYAAENNITFRQDPTNTENTYLRNRLREKLYAGTTPTYQEKMLSLWQKQQTVREEIEKLTKQILPRDAKTLPKNLFTTTQTEVAIELLIAALERRNLSLTRPQLADLLRSIKTYSPGKRHNLPKNRFVTIHRETIDLVPLSTLYRGG